MTRINAGILPCELCDAHLIAEYKELPRMVAFAEKRLSTHGSAGPRPQEPTLGTGHMAYFLPFGKTLQDRFLSLVAEMKYRGFSPAFDWRGYPQELNGIMDEEHEAKARILLMDRIRTRLAGMDRVKWTKRNKPEWACVHAEHHKQKEEKHG
jgi:hypothetical protein